MRAWIDAGNANAETQSDVVGDVPVERIQRNVIQRFLSRQNRRKLDAVVVGVGLIAEHGDIELRMVAQDLLERGDAGHAVADDDEPLGSLLRR